MNPASPDIGSHENAASSADESQKETPIHNQLKDRLWNQIESYSSMEGTVTIISKKNSNRYRAVAAQMAMILS